MIVYLVIQSEAYESSTIAGIFSTRAAAEDCWQVKYEGYDIDEYELDHYEFSAGYHRYPMTEEMHKEIEASRRIFDMCNRQILENLKRPYPFMSDLKPLPVNTGQQIQFFTYKDIKPDDEEGYGHGV